ncbi:MAG TPA: hypothetical protein VEA59_00610, partial [Patescibacteria group bacterium]|nr:hypothetical protein [Patescibacteria group bacterium]
TGRPYTCSISIYSYIAQIRFTTERIVRLRLTYFSSTVRKRTWRYAGEARGEKDGKMRRNRRSRSKQYVPNRVVL